MQALVEGSIVESMTGLSEDVDVRGRQAGNPIDLGSMQSHVRTENTIVNDPRWLADFQDRDRRPIAKLVNP